MKLVYISSEKKKKEYGANMALLIPGGWTIWKPLGQVILRTMENNKRF